MQSFMTRRSFLPAAGAAALGGAAEAAPKQNAWIEIGIAHMRNTHENQPKRVADYFRDAVVPALTRAGAGPIGVFNCSIGTGAPFMMTVVSYPSFAAYGELMGKLMGDTEFLNASRAFDLQQGLSYERAENSMLRAFDGMPTVVPPPLEGNRPPRVFEVRMYESNSASSLRTKIKMFNEGEIGIFQRLGMSPVFFGQTIIGRNQPNLVYMLAFDDMAHRERAWKAFGSDPEWQKMRLMPGYADPDIVSNITNFIVSPLPFSAIR
jgi:LPS sulfotransferase NodH